MPASAALGPPTQQEAATGGKLLPVAKCHMPASRAQASPGQGAEMSRAKGIGQDDTPAEMPGEATQADRFCKTRSAQSTALLEDYVELIDDLLATVGEARPTDIARRPGVAHATAIK